VCYIIDKIFITHIHITMSIPYKKQRSLLGMQQSLPIVMGPTVKNNEYNMSVSCDTQTRHFKWAPSLEWLTHQRNCGLSVEHPHNFRAARRYAAWAYLRTIYKRPIYDDRWVATEVRRQSCESDDIWFAKEIRRMSA
jgi:hypothetical protein